MSEDCSPVLADLAATLVGRWPIITARPIQGSSKLPLSLNVCHRDLRADNFNLIYKKYMQYFYLQINLLKN